MPRNDEYDDRYDDRYEEDRLRARRDDPDYDDQDQGYDDYEDRPRRRGGRRARALERVSMPAIFMMILGGLGLVFAVVRTVLDLTIGADAGPNPFAPQNNDPAMKDLQKSMMIIGPILNVIWGLIVLFGGLQMKSLKNRGFVIFSCIWAMLPCSLCCLLGIPFGIWALVVVNDETVKRAF